MTVMSNMANSTGSGLYLYHSQLKCERRNTFDVFGNKAKNFGGEIHAINSQITVFCDRSFPQPQGSINLINNVAQRRGGIYLESGAQIRIQKSQSDKSIAYNRINMLFASNSGDHGEAILLCC